MVLQTSTRGVVKCQKNSKRHNIRQKEKLGNRHMLCRRFGKGIACVGPSGRRNLPTIKVYQPTAGIICVTIV